MPSIILIIRLKLRKADTVRAVYVNFPTNFGVNQLTPLSINFCMKKRSSIIQQFVKIIGVSRVENRNGSTCFQFGALHYFLKLL